MGTILSRIQEIASAEGITIGALERQIGASKGVLSRAINKGTDIQSKWIQIIVENYPKYSPGWLLTGRGEMLIDEEPCDSSTASSVYNIASTGSAAHVVSEQPAQDATAELIDKLLDRITEQAAEIGRQRELIHQMRQRFEKDAANASTGTIADVG